MGDLRWESGYLDPADNSGVIRLEGGQVGFNKLPSSPRLACEGQEMRAEGLLESALVFRDEPLEMMEQHTIEDGSLRMTRTVDSWHIGNAYSRSMPGTPEARSGG